MPLLDPPLSVLLALWLPVPSSRAIGVVQGEGGEHWVSDDEAARRAPLAAWLAETGRPRRAAALVSTDAEPLPGLAAVSASGEGVLVQTARGATVLLEPEPDDDPPLWHVHRLAAGPAPFDAPAARRRVQAATERAIGALTALDVARARPERTEELVDLATAVIDPGVLPPTLEPRRRELLERALRLEAICSLALADDGAAPTAQQARERSQALRPLLAVAREGVAAATEWWSSDQDAPSTAR